VRIVALDAEASLAAALNMFDEWDVVYASEPEQAAEQVPGMHVVLIGGGTDGGLELAESLRHLGVTIPIIVIGDAPASQGTRYPVVTRPFTLTELHSAIDEAVSSASQSAPLSSLAQGSAASSERDETPETSRSRHLEIAREPAEVLILRPESPEPATEEMPVPVEADSRPTQNPALVAHEDADRVSAPASTLAPPLRRPQEQASRGLLRRRTKEEHASTEDPMLVLLTAAFDSLGNLERAVDELPVLTDLAELTQALLREVLDLFWPQTAAIYLPGPDGFRVWASHGFSNVEKTMAVQTHQPLFVDLLVRHESVLIEPLDMAQQLAAGVGGARTKAFLATPIEVNQKCVGVIVAGREHFENEDLDHLAALAKEASLGLGIALGLDRLRTKLI
jgi:hypothetical protein